jgi:pilus assembly protein CpaF
MIGRDIHDRNLRSLLSPIAALIDDHEVTEIMVNGPTQVYVERRGKLERTSVRFAGSEALMAAILGIAQYTGRSMGPGAQILEARLPDGSRIEAVIPPAAPDGPMLCIRRFSRCTLTLEELVARGSVREEGAALLRELIATRRNILVAGGTGSGKTSLLNAMASHIDEGQRVVVIEDARELQLPHEHVVQLEARPPDGRGRGEVTVRQLFKATLRLRPDRIVVGEIRGAEALELIQAMTSGHGGCLSTIHATSPRDALARLETMALMSDVELPHAALRAQVASAIDVVVQTSRVAGGGRCVTEVAEVKLDPQGYAVTAIYRSIPVNAHEDTQRPASTRPTTNRQTWP